jgi:outer membrane biosynthesis protein TonB
MTHALRRLVVAVVLAGLSAPAFAQYVMPQNEKLGEAKVNAVRTEAPGPKCKLPEGVTTPGEIVCPTVKVSGNANDIRNAIGEAKGRKIKLGFCVSTRGDPGNIEVIESTNKPKVDTAMKKFIKTWTYTPGTVGGAPAELCGVQADFLF